MELQLIHGPWPLYTNSFLLFTPSGSALVIDPNADPGVYEKALADRGARLTHILLTHGHYDHVGAVAALLAGLPLPDATQVLPGHGELSTLGQERDTNPYLQGQWF